MQSGWRTFRGRTHRAVSPSGPVRNLRTNGSTEPTRATGRCPTGRAQHPTSRDRLLCRGGDMVYLPELHYLQDQAGFPFRKAVTLTAAATSRWSSHFYAKLIATRPRYAGPTHRSGPLPPNPQEKAALVAELVTWLFEHSMADRLFCLLLDDAPVPQPGRVATFDHHDDTPSWAMDLTEREFTALQAEWREHGLPEDLFYPEEDSVCIPYPGGGWKARLLRAVGVQRCYTPRQWANRRTGTARGVRVTHE